MAGKVPEVSLNNGATRTHGREHRRLDFRLTADEMARVAGLETGRSHIVDHHDPERVTRLGGVRSDT
ncbi:hypothetical protein ACFYOA_35075 [Streptomyces iakyrus]|uniref:hypothetical protein n=1 Tax=Streptomyces iakyrus TaxID=68219 RepID=UPI00369EF862